MTGVLDRQFGRPRRSHHGRLRRHPLVMPARVQASSRRMDLPNVLTPGHRGLAVSVIIWYDPAPMLPSYDDDGDVPTPRKRCNVDQGRAEDGAYSQCTPEFPPPPTRR